MYVEYIIVKPVRLIFLALLEKDIIVLSTVLVRIIKDHSCGMRSPLKQRMQLH